MIVQNGMKTIRVNDKKMVLQKAVKIKNNYVFVPVSLLKQMYGNNFSLMKRSK